MPFFILFLLVLAAQPLPWPAPPFNWGVRGSLLATAVATSVPVLMASWLANHTRRWLLMAPADRERTIRNYNRGRFVHLMTLIGAQFGALGLLGWGWAVRTICGAETPQDQPIGAELLLIAPFFFGLVLSWAAIYPAEHTLAGAFRPFGGRWGYVSFQGRQYLTVIGLPIGLMVMARGLQWALGDRADGAWMLLGLAGLIGAALVLAPWPLRFILGARPLPRGPIRDRLEVAARRLKFRYSDILLWDTRNGIANAMVAGPIPWVRYVFLSDRLLAELTPAEVEAVFGHEVGHIRHRHFFLYAAFMGLSVALVVWSWTIAMQWLFGGLNISIADSQLTASQAIDSWRNWESVPLMLFIGTYVFIVFGYLSRRCERQADIYGCRAVSYATDPEAFATMKTDLSPAGIQTFVSALNKVALINGISRRRPGLLNAWLHGTIARRVEFLEGMIFDPDAERRFQRRLGLLKWSLLTGLTVGLLILAAGHWEEIRPGVWAG